MQNLTFTAIYIHAVSEFTFESIFFNISDATVVQPIEADQEDKPQDQQEGEPTVEKFQPPVEK